MPQKSTVELNPSQNQAVQYNEGHLLVLAGAGSGKTRVLASKIVQIIDTGLASPWQILAMTFTNKAAAQMRERVGNQLESNIKGLRMGTFHGVCAWILRREARALGFSENFTIYDADDQKRLINRILKRGNLPAKITLGAAKAFISASKNGLITAAEALEAAQTPFDEARAVVYDVYEKELRKNAAFDFDDLLTQVLVAIRQKNDIADHYRGLFTRILVDEYQDTNLVQNEILKELTGEKTVVTVVGDDDQSIYGWRGARVENILNFPKEFPGAKTIRLETNYRSTGNILLAASSLVRHNRNRHGKTLRTVSGPGEKVRIMQTTTPEDEAFNILSVARDLNADGTPWREIAVLFRTNAQSRAFETACIRHMIPYEVVGTVRFFERAEVKDVVSYLRIVVNPTDAQSFRRVLNRPRRGVGEKGQSNFFAWMEQNGKDVVTALQMSDSIPGIKRSGRAALQHLGNELRSCMKAVESGEPAEVVVKMVIDASGLLSEHESGDPDSQNRLDNIHELLRYAKEYDLRNPERGLPGFLVEQSLLSSSDSYTGDDKLVLMTLHSAKGLEFDCVFVSGLEEGMLPYIKPQEYSPRDLEEERRLLYVGITRARKRLCLTWCMNRPRAGGYALGPSRFLAEIASGRSDDDSTARSEATQKTDTVGIQQPKQRYSRGNLVKHPRYGRGIVVSAKRRGAEWELKINFGFDEPKTLLTGYVPIPVLKERADGSELR